MSGEIETGGALETDPGVGAGEPRAAIAVDGASVRYGRIEAVRQVSLAVEPGSVYALLGRNGAGKSSLVRCLLGHRPLSAGTIRLLGADPWRHRTHLMERIGVVAERPELPPRATASTLAGFVARVRDRFDRSGFLARLDRFGVPARRPFRSLSRGQQTIVALALALATDPELLVLDDPTLGLDAVARKALYSELIETLAAREVTILVTSHDLAGIERIATHAGILVNGALAVDEPIDALRERFCRVRVSAVELARLEATAPAPLCRRPTAWGGEEWVIDLERRPRLEGQDDFEGGWSDASGREPMDLEAVFEAVTGGEEVWRPAGPIAEPAEPVANREAAR